MKYIQYNDLYKVYYDFSTIDKKLWKPEKIKNMLNTLKVMCNEPIDIYDFNNEPDVNGFNNFKESVNKYIIEPKVYKYKTRKTILEWIDNYEFYDKLKNY